MADVIKAAELICHTEQVYVELTRSEDKKYYAVHEQVGVNLKTITACHKDFDKAVKTMHNKLVLKVPSVSLAKQKEYKTKAAAVRSAIANDYESFVDAYSPSLALLTSLLETGDKHRLEHVLSRAQGPHHLTRGGPGQVLRRGSRESKANTDLLLLPRKLDTRRYNLHDGGTPTGKTPTTTGMLLHPPHSQPRACPPRLSMVLS
jgi:hypothetical protein